MFGSRNKINNFQLGGLQPILYDDSVMHLAMSCFPCIVEILADSKFLLKFNDF